MGKKRHTQDKLWITYKELVQDWGGKKEDDYKTIPIKNLPFYCCSLSFMPFTDPVCLQDGTIFDIVNILPYIKKFKRNPVTGKPLKVTELIKLNFFKNQEGEYHCPVTYKVFTENTKIIAIKETGNVYSYEAYDELNKKPKNFKDLLYNKPFYPKNIIIIQDPYSNQRLIKDFHFVRNKEDIDFIRYGEDNQEKTNFVNLSSTYMKLIENYEENIKNKPNEITSEDDKKVKSEVEEYETNISNLEKEIENIKTIQNYKKIFKISPLAYIYYLKKHNQHSHERFTEGKTASSFTSTYVDPSSKNIKRNLTEDELRNKYYNIIKSRQLKGFLRINTNYGFLNVQLHSDLVPKTCENFVELAESGYFNNTIFHRMIKKFVLQGGDPTGTGFGGVSIFGKSFEDEFNPKLTHKCKGILSMANSGKNTNNSQFFITLAPASHLDNKHSVFGEVVGNIKLLDEFESIGSDENDRPLKDIKIINVEVYTNPFREVISELLIKEFSEKFSFDKSEFELEKKIDSVLNQKIESGEIGKYLGKKRGMFNYVSYAHSDPYIYEKPNKDRRGKFDFTNW